MFHLHRKQVVDLMDFLKNGNTSLSNGILPSEVVQVLMVIWRVRKRITIDGLYVCHPDLKLS